MDPTHPRRQVENATAFRLRGRPRPRACFAIDRFGQSFADKVPAAINPFFQPQINTASHRFSPFPICVHLWFNLKDDIPINQIIAGIEIEIGIAPPIGNKNPQANALNPTIAVSRRCPSHMGDIS
ncbi:MAG: hypothetical protein QM518_15530 [Verrucomicrobiota bacterium]|nr:hypothetical protein [Verrucomicrobiota bacterium]